MPVDVPALILSPSDRGEIERWLQAHGTPQQVALRDRIVLASAGGMNACAVARELGTNRKTGTLRGGRHRQPVGSGAGPRPQADLRACEGRSNRREATLRGKPQGMTHWSCRTMARSQGIGKSTVNTIWNSHKLRPHRRDLQAVARCAFPGEADRRGRTLPQSAATGAGAVHR